MKKLLKYIPVVALFFMACNPMDEVYDELDAQIKPYKVDVEYTITTENYKSISSALLALAENKEDSAYAKSIATDLAFNQKYQASELVGPVIAARFPSLEEKSTALVTYNVYEKTEQQLAYETASVYKLGAEDYTSIGGDVEKNGYFFPSEPASKHLPTLLSGKYPNAVDGDMAYVTYNLSDKDPAGSVILFSDNFEDGTLDKWNAVSVLGDQIWAIDATHGVDGSQCGKMSGYSGGSNANEDWLISSAINLSGVIDPVLSFYTACNYDGDNIVVKYSTNYAGSGDPTTATWTEFSNYTISEGAWAWTESGDVDLSSLSGTIYIAFIYTSTVEMSKTWEVDNILVKGMESTKSAKAADYSVYNDFFTYDGTAWVKETEALVFNPSDYDLMKITEFSSSNSPANYLPNYLKYKFPFALEGTTEILAYMYSGSLSTSIYTLSMGEWTKLGPIYEKVDQFVYGTTGWVFDPTIKLSPTAADYQLLVDYVYANLSRDYGSKYGNDEFYYGASAYYQNFDLRLTNKTAYNIPGFEGLETEAGVALTWEKLEEGISILLGLKFTEAVEEVSGITVYYWFTFKTYENDLAKNTYTGIFKYVEGTGFVRDLTFEDQMVDEGQIDATLVSWNR